MTKLLIVDDHKALCDLFKGVFAQEADFEVLGELQNASLAVGFCRMRMPDLILMDICAEGKAGGLEAAEELKKRFPKIRIILMSGFDEISFIPRAKEIGVEAFVHKSSSLDYFLDVARRVVQGERIFPEPKKIELPRGQSPFTEKEMEILRLLCACKGRKEIAEQLFISENTVKYHIGNMIAKAGVSNAAELAIFTISGGWINPRY